MADSFIGLGVIVTDGAVYRAGTLGSKGAYLGPLEGAEATVTDGTSRHTLTRVMTVAGAFTKRHRAAALVVAGNGAMHEHELNNAGQLRRAQTEVIRFNALAREAPRAASAKEREERERRRRDAANQRQQSAEERAREADWERWAKGGG